MKKLKSRSGETITEALVSILIIAISAAMLATMISAAVNISIKANEATEQFYVQLTTAESGAGVPKTGTVRINGVGYTVNFYGEADGLTAYR